MSAQAVNKLLRSKRAGLRKQAVSDISLNSAANLPKLPKPAPARPAPATQLVSPKITPPAPAETASPDWMPKPVTQTIGSNQFRPDPAGFAEDYGKWWSGIKPDRQAAFTQASKTLNMTPQDVMRALSAKEHLRKQMPFSYGPTRQDAMGSWEQGKLDKVPERPDYKTRMMEYLSLPEDYRNALGKWQDYQIDNAVSKNPFGGKPGFSSMPANIGNGDGQDWYFPAKKEYQAEMFDADGKPQLLDPEKYQGLETLARRYGIDFRNKDFRDWWANQQTSPGVSDWWASPAERLQGYWWDRERRQGNHDFDTSQQGANAQRFFGFRRTDPRTGQEVFTPGSEVGKNPHGLGGALKDTLLGVLSSPATAVTSLAEQDPRYAQMGGRSTLSVLNHLLGTDMGWNANTTANPDGFAKGQAGYGTEIGQNIPTTRSLFGATYDPITGENKMGVTDAAGTYYNEQADNPENSRIGRILSRGMAGTMNYGDDVIANIALLKSMNLPVNVQNLMMAGAASKSIPNWLEGQSNLQTVSQAANDSALPFSANPLFPMAGQAFKELPGSKHYFDLANRLRYHGAANEQLPKYLRAGSDITANVMEALPEMALAAGASKKLPTGNLITDTSRFSPKAVAGYSGLQGTLQSLAGTNPLQDPESFREMMDMRLGLSRPEQMRFDESQKKLQYMLPLLAKGVGLPEGVSLQDIDMQYLTPRQQEVLTSLLSADTKQQANMLQEQGYQGSPVATKQPKSPDPHMPTLTAGYSAPSSDTLQQLQSAVSKMSPEEQLAWSSQLKKTQEAFANQYQQAGTSLPKEQLLEYARLEAMRSILEQIQQRQGMEKQNANVATPPAPKVPTAPAVELPPIPQLSTERMYGSLNNFDAPAPASAPPPSQPQPAPSNPIDPVPPKGPVSNPTTTPAAMDKAKMQQPPPPSQQPQPPSQQPQLPSQQPQPQPQGQQPQQPVDSADVIFSMIPYGNELKTITQQSPEWASKAVDSAAGQLKQLYGATPEAKETVSGMLQTGEVTPEVAQKGVAAWTSAGYDPKTAQTNWNNMSTPGKVILGAGLGLGVLGLISALSGKGGIGSWLMSALGLGAAAFAGGQAGLLDKGMMDFTQGASDALGGLTAAPKKQPIVQPSAQGGISLSMPSLLQMGTNKGLQTLLDSGIADSPQAMEKLRPLVDMLPKNIQSQLDRAAGTGSWGNSAWSWLGDVSGQRQQMMQEKLGLNPEQQQKLLELWRRYRSKPEVR